MLEQVLQGVRNWIMAVNSIGENDLLIAHEERPKPTKPFLMIQPLQHFVRVGQPEQQRRRNAGNIEIRVESHRYTTFQIDAYGDAAFPWLEELEGTLDRSDVRKVLLDENLDMEPDSPIRYNPVVVADTYERRDNQDWRASYQVRSDWYVVGSEFTELRVGGSLKAHPDESDADDLDLDYTLTD